jgi:hypothetical protein
MNYPDDFKGTNMDFSEDNIFEATRLGECESCNHLQPVNEYDLCQHCNEEAEAFEKAAGECRLNGGTREEAYKAGMLHLTSLDNVLRVVDKIFGESEASKWINSPEVTEWCEKSKSDGNYYD